MTFKISILCEKEQRDRQIKYKQMEGGKDRWIHGQPNRQRCRGIDGKTDRGTEGQTDSQIDGRLDGLTDSQTDSLSDRRTGRQTQGVLSIYFKLTLTL